MRRVLNPLVLVMVVVIVGQADAVHAGDAPAPADDLVKTTLVSLEKRSWVAWKARDNRFFETFLSEDHVEVGAGGFANKAAVVASVGGPVCEVKSYAVTDFRFTRIADDTAALNYRAEQQTTCGGIAVPSPAWATSIYVRRNGKWLNIIYQQTPLSAR